MLFGAAARCESEDQPRNGSPARLRLGIRAGCTPGIAERPSARVPSRAALQARLERSGSYTTCVACDKCRVLVRPPCRMHTVWWSIVFWMRGPRFLGSKLAANLGNHCAGVDRSSRRPGRGRSVVGGHQLVPSSRKPVGGEWSAETARRRRWASAGGQTLAVRGWRRRTAACGQ